MTVRIGTRGSDLALWQARHIAESLGDDVATEIVVISTKGDEVDDKPLTALEGQSFFTAEIERALAEKEVDLAVHSLKDLATETPPGLLVVAVPPRASADERLLIRTDAHDAQAALLPLAVESTVGTSSPRRKQQLLALRPDLHVNDLRGNVPTRVRRLREGKYDAVLLAAAGLERLELDTSGLVVVTLPTARLVPAPGQGALAVQIREDDGELVDLCKSRLHDAATAQCVDAERVLLTRAGGGCHLPLGALVERGEDDCVARVFLGAGVPEADGASRWARGHGATPQAAVDDAWAQLTSGDPTEEGPFAGLRVTLVGSAEGGTTLGERLAQLGARVLHEKVLAFEDVGAPDLTAKLARLQPGDVLAVTSGEAARRLAGERPPTGVKVAAVGPATAKALSALGITPDIVGKGGARALARRLEVRDDGCVLFPCAEGARPELPDSLTERGVRVERVVLYRTVSEAVSEPSPAEVRVYMSPSAVASSVALEREAVEGLGLRIGLGGSTCDALQDEGLDHERPQGSGPEAVVSRIAQIFANHNDTSGPR